MANLIKEHWVNTLTENLFADDTFVTRSIDHSAFVDGEKVHVPNAGAKPTITKNGTTFPMEASQRTDADVNYAIDAYRTEPIYVQNAEQIQLNYDKINSVLMNAKSALQETMALSVLSNWISKATGTGHCTTASTFKRETLLAVKLAFDKQDIPQSGRCIILTPEAYSSLFGDLQGAEQYAFSASANAERGTIGTLFGFDVYMRSKLDNAEGSKVIAFAWHEGAVSRALGNTQIFENQNDALYFGDIISAEVLAGGAAIRNDKSGIYKVEATSEDDGGDDGDGGNGGGDDNGNGGGDDNGDDNGEEEH